MTREEQKDYDNITERMHKAEGIVREINGELVSKGFEILGWHLNGETEPLDNWFAENDWQIEVGE